MASDFNALVYALGGQATWAPTGRPFHEGQLVVLGWRRYPPARRGQDSRTPALDLYIMGGEPIGEPPAGPFVMNTHEELARARSTTIAPIGR